MRLLMLLGLFIGVGYVAYWSGQYESRTLCRRTIQHRLVLTRESAERLLDEEARLWSGP
jgi:hypothetical protein